MVGETNANTTAHSNRDKISEEKQSADPDDMLAGYYARMNALHERLNMEIYNKKMQRKGWNAPEAAEKEPSS